MLTVAQVINRLQQVNPPSLPVCIQDANGTLYGVNEVALTVANLGDDEQPVIALTPNLDTREATDNGNGSGDDEAEEEE